MEAVSAKRRDVEYNLSQDETKVKELHESLNQSQKLTTSMVAILESFQNRLNKLDKNIMPVYQKTKQLTQLQENVDQTLNKLEQVIGYHHIADEVEPKLRGGPAGDIEGYLKLLDKLRVAVDFFKYNNPSSDELSHVNSCFDQGIEMLEKEFSQLLRNHSSPVQFSALQKLMEESKEGGAKPTIQHLPDDIVKDLATICRYVVTVAGGEGRTDILASYTQIRSKILGRTLNSFTESTSVSRKQAFTPFSSTPTKKQSGRKKETSTSSSIRNKIMVPTKLSGNFIAGEVVNEIDEQLEGSSSIIKLSTILVKLMKTEWDMMERIIPSRHHGYVFGLLVSEPIKFLLAKSDVVIQVAQRQLSRNEYLTIIPLVRIVQQIHLLLPEYRTLLFNTSSSDDSYNKISVLVEALEKLSIKGMQEYILFIKGDSEKHSNLPKDGTVHELTSNTMWFLEQLLEFPETVGRLQLFSESDFDEEDCRKAVGSYMIHTLNGLTMNLEQKSRTYESSVLAAIFLLNNYYFIQSTFIRRDEMLQLMKLALADIENYYITLIDNQRRAYQRGFNKLLSNLGTLSINAPPSKSQKQLLKDHFKGFNVELEELLRIQKDYSIPDSTLRRRVRDENITLIVIPYSNFYHDYSSVNFTKNYDKYVKFRPEEVEDKLNMFFDQGAQ